MVATGVLGIGSGAAGLAAAREAAERGARVLLVTGGSLLSGSSPRAQGGLAAAVGADDDVRLQARAAATSSRSLWERAEGERRVPVILSEAKELGAESRAVPGHQTHQPAMSKVPDPSPVDEKTTLGALLDRYVGVTRDAEGLPRAISALPDPNNPWTSPDLRVAGFAARAAYLRLESRGAHSRSDYPESDPRWRGRICWRRGEQPTFEEI